MMKQVKSKLYNYDMPSLWIIAMYVFDKGLKFE